MAGGIDISNANIMMDGGTILNVAYSSTAPITRARVARNRTFREKTTVMVDSTQDGTVNILEVDDTGRTNSILSFAVTANVLSVTDLAFSVWGIHVTFTPDAATAGTIKTRVYFAGIGMGS